MNPTEIKISIDSAFDVLDRVMGRIKYLQGQCDHYIINNENNVCVTCRKAILDADEPRHGGAK